jgi:hypothetical protein
MMIPFWNRREVFMGFDIDQLTHVREALTAAGIPYIQRSSGHTVRSRMGSFGENSTFAALYYIYVHKDNLDQAHTALKSYLQRY